MKDSQPCEHTRPQARGRQAEEAEQRAGQAKQGKTRPNGRQCRQALGDGGYLASPPQAGWPVQSRPGQVRSGQVR